MGAAQGSRVASSSRGQVASTTRMQPRSQRLRQCTACSILEATQETGGGKIDAAQAAGGRLRTRRTASPRSLQAQRQRRAFATNAMVYWLFYFEDHRAKSCQKQRQGARCNHRRRMIRFVRDLQGRVGVSVDQFELKSSSASRPFRMKAQGVCVRRSNEAWGEAADTAHRLMSKRGVTQRCGSVLTSNDSAATQACVVRSSRGTNRWATRWERACE